MKGAITVIRYQLRDVKAAVLIFYSGLALMISLSMFNSGGVGGLGGSTVVFIFILGLSSFTSSFKFTQANGVSRRRFHLSTTISLVVLAALLAGVDTLVTQLLKQLVDYQGMMEQLYRTDLVLPDFIWSFALYAFTAFTGWMIVLTYYRCSKSQRTLVSVLLLVPGLAYFSSCTNGAVGRAIISFLVVVLGLSGTPNPYIASLSFMVGTVVVASLSILLIRRITI